jgi:hypothetical protein
VVSLVGGLRGHEWQAPVVVVLNWMPQTDRP